MRLWGYQLAPIEGLGKQFICTIAKDPREAVIAFIDAPIEIGHDHPENVGLHQRAQLQFAVLELLL